MYQKITKKLQKKKKKVQKKNKKSSLSLITKKCKNVFLFELVSQFSSNWKKKSENLVEILCNIAIKLATGEVTKVCVILMKV